MGTWVNISGATTLPVDAQVNFCSFLNKAYMVGATSGNSYLTTASISGTTYTSESGFPKARFAIEYFDRLYLLDCNVGNTRYPSRAYYSSVPASDDSITFTTATDYLGVQTDNGDTLMGAAKSYGRLMLFKKNSLHSWNLSTLDQVEGIGTTSSRSIQTIKNNVFYLHYSNIDKGIFVWQGSESIKISEAIQPFIDGMSLPTSAPSGVHNKHYLLFIGDVTLDASVATYYGLESTYTNVLVDYSVSDNSFVLHSLNVPVKVMSEYNGDLYFGDNTGKVYQWDSGTTDDGTAITATIITANFYGLSLGEFNKIKSIESIITNMNVADVGTAYYSVDNSAWETLGLLDSKVTLYPTSDKGYGYKEKITGVGQDFCFEGNEYNYFLEETLR